MNISTKTCCTCGTNLPENTRFCPNCGTSTENPVSAASFSETYIASSDSINPYPPSSIQTLQPSYNAYSHPYYANPQPYPNPYPSQQSSNGKAVAGLVLGILSLITTGVNVFIGFIFAILGLIFSCLARKETKGKPNGIATAGLVCSICGLILCAVLTILIVLLYIYFFCAMIVTIGVWPS